MNSVLLTVLIQSAISIFIIYEGARSKKAGHKYLFIVLYLTAILGDVIYESLAYYFFDKKTFIDLPSSFRYAKGPLLFLFARQSLGRPVSRKKVLWHFVPFYLAFIYNVITLIVLITQSEWTSVIIEGYKSLFTVYPIYWVGYLLLTCFIIFFRVKEKSGELWYLRILIIYLLVTVGGFLAVHFILGVRNESLMSAYLYLFLVQFAIVVLMIWKTGNKTVTKKSADQRGGSTIEVKEAARLKALIMSAFEDKKLHLEESFSLADLADYTGVSRHHITEVITGYMETTFYDLLNKYRIESFVLQFEKDPTQKVTDVFYNCGFKSKTTFYKYFNLYRGMSPTEYKGRLMSRE